MTPKTIKTNLPYTAEYGKYNVSVKIGEYVSNKGSKAIILTDSDDGSPFATATRFIQPLGANQVTLDINNLPDITDFLIENQIVEPKPFGNCISGHCVYPIYKLHEEVIKKL